MTRVLNFGYQCDRCKRLMEAPALGRGPATGAAQHYCEVCAIAVIEAEKRGEVQP